MIQRLTAVLFILQAIFVIPLLIAQPAQPAASPEYRILADIPYRDGGASGRDAYMEERCRLDLYYPVNSADFATVVWFHGGWLKGGERSIPEELKNKGIAVVAVNYRLSPRVKCPAYIEDAAAAVGWVFRHIVEYGGNPGLIFVAGHSAGGYLSAMIGLDKKWLAAFGIDADRIAGIIPVSGHTITHTTVREERGIPRTRPVIDEFAPLYHVRRDAPPLILITGDRRLELLGRYEENAYLQVMMKEAGHEKTELYEIQGFDHGEMVNPALTILLKRVERLQQESGKK